MAKHPGVQHLAPSRRFPSGGWVVRYRDPDNRTLRRTFETRQQALDFQARVRTDKNRGEWIDPSLAKTPFRTMAETWYADTVDLRPKTRVGYRNILDHHLLPAFGAKAIAHVTPSAIRTYLAGLDCSPGTKRNILRVLSPIMALAVDDGMVKANPVARIKTADTDAASPEVRVLTAEQVASLANEVGPHYRTLIWFAAYSGCRAGEIGALRVKDLDLLHRRVLVRESLSDVNGHLHFVAPKTKAGRRAVALPIFLVDLLVEEMAGKAPDDLVFPGPQGGPRRHGNFMRRIFRAAVKRLANSLGHPEWPEEFAKVRFHDLRHTCASMLIAQGMQPLAVSRHLGHSSISITFDRYGHLFPNEQDKLSDALQAVYAQDTGTVTAAKRK